MATMVARTPSARYLTKCWATWAPQRVRQFTPRHGTHSCHFLSRMSERLMHIRLPKATLRSEKAAAVTLRMNLLIEM
jgi:hypothetical protein